MSRFNGISTTELKQVLKLVQKIEKEVESMGFRVQLLRLNTNPKRVNGVVRKEEPGPRARFKKKYSRAQRGYWREIKSLMRSKGLDRQAARKAYREQRATVGA
jgi:hypothetical protein